MSYQPPRQRPQLPPVPPQLKHANTIGSGRPPLPPVPQPYLAEAAEQQRWEKPLLQPRPQRAEASIPADRLQSQADAFHRPMSAAPPPPSFAGGFLPSPVPGGGPAGPRRSYSEGVDSNPPPFVPSFPVPQVAPHPAGDRFSQSIPAPPLTLPLPQSPPALTMSDLRFSTPQPPALPARLPQSVPEPSRPATELAWNHARDRASSSAEPGARTLAKPPVDLPTLARRRDAAADPLTKVQWAKAVLKFIERFQAESALGDNATRISDPQMVKFTDEALKIILACASSSDPVPEALYLRGDLSATGSFPSYRPKDTKVAFRDFEAAANAGFKGAWFRIGREYEAYSEWKRAQTAHERGMSLGDCSSTYRLGMAYLLGQLEMQADIVKAVAYLRSAADLADSDTPQPAYIYGMLLAGEFESLPPIPADVLRPDTREAKNRIEHAAYLGFGSAQYKMGWLHEYAQLGCAFDPLLSVEYYSLASKQGETEADMALSKWFLCGAEGSFAANEGLAVTFAEKAARKGLPSAMFAIAYYFEIGIGGQRDLASARKWYSRAVDGGNKDAKERLDALDRGGPGLSRHDHENNVDVALVRKRTMAFMKSQKEHGTSEPLPFPGGGINVRPPAGNSSTTTAPPGAVNLRRGETMRRVEEARVVALNTLTESKNERRRQSGGPNGFSGPISNHSTTPRPLSSATSTPALNGTSRPQQMQGDINDRKGRKGSSGTSGLNASPRRQESNRPVSYQLSDSGPISNASVAAGSSKPPGPGATISKPTTTFNSFADMGISTTTAQNSSECIVM